MIKWFESNPVGVTLASICGGLLLISLLLGVFWSLPPSAEEPGSVQDDAITALDVPQLEDSEPLEEYAVITERPVFNASRLPIIEEDAEEEADELEEEEEVEAPELELAGVVITPSIRMVTLRTEDRSESLVAFEGQPLEGDFGTWQVTEIEPREITLASDSGEELQLKLQVHDVTIEEPPEIEPEETEELSGDEEQVADSASAAESDSDQPLSRAEEIRRRITQRREELRRAAEEKQREQEQREQQAQESDYTSAIQSMMSGSRRKQEQDENDR